MADSYNGELQKVSGPPVDGVCFPLDRIEGHSSHSTPRDGLKTQSPLSENTGVHKRLNPSVLIITSIPLVSGMDSSEFHLG